MSISVCTTNKNKVREFERILQVPLNPVAINLDEIQALDTELVCKRKAQAAYDRLGQPVVVDDTGFELAALNGFPGALVTWAIGAGTTQLLARMLPEGSPPGATVVTVIGYAHADGVEMFEGRLEGQVIATPRGENGFGFDDVFVPHGETRTLAEMSDDEKDSLSPRGTALRALADYLKSLPRARAAR